MKVKNGENKSGTGTAKGTSEEFMIGLEVNADS